MKYPRNMGVEKRTGVLFLWMVTSLVSLALGETSDLREVKYESMLPQMHRFQDQDREFGDFTEILIDFQRYQLIVGARDAIYRLSLNGLDKLEKAVWKAKSTAVGLCTAKGQTDENCRNFIKVLVSRKDQLFVCGTNAFKPRCSWREIEDINKVVQWIDGRGKCPHSPHSNSTAHMTSSGDYYIASSTDFSGNDHAIYRMSGARFEDLVRTVQYNSLWLSRPNFVGSFETKNYIYFLFRETAVEYINCGKAIYSRIARICKNDKGGTLVLKDNWTTFLKARLNCSIPGEYPFYYNEIQSMQYLEEEEVVYATFTTGENSIDGSAICTFNLSAIESAFNGDFKHQSQPDSTWEPVSDDHSHFECKKDSNQHLAVNSKNYQLMNSAVQSATNLPLYKENLIRFTHIAVEPVSTKHEDRNSVHVIFVATQDGAIKKLSFNTVTHETCLIEILNPFPRGKHVTINNMKLFEATNSLYLATRDSVLQISSERCRKFQSKLECLNAMDPYCGWNTQKQACTATPNRNPRAGYFIQEKLSCPVLNTPVNGEWGPWAEWHSCDKMDRRDFRAKSPLSGNAGSCKCRNRNCDNPLPQNGGSECFGSHIEVTNCTQNGDWTPWSEWSACSNTCDIGVRKRKRTCGNPAPAFGGNVCIGNDVDSQVCSDLPPCDHQTSSSYATRSSLLQRDKWSEWEDWSKCSTDCGTGFQSRSRICFGSNCDQSCSKEYKVCSQKKCTEMAKQTNWTPWIKGNRSFNGDWYEKRFSFTFLAPTTLNQFGEVKEEERFCRASSKQCSLTSIVSSKTDPDPSQQLLWTEWSQCTKECGGGSQIRLRECHENDLSCKGQSMTVIERQCNTQPCQGQWTCWSEWSNCDSNSKKRRYRQCRSPQGYGSATCEDEAGYEEIDCDGWGPWGAWSECYNDLQTRFRTCHVNQCSGNDRQTQKCGADEEKPDLIVTESASTAPIIAGTFIGFLFGIFLGGVLVYYFLIVRRPGGHGSPHYVSAKSQNLYVSLPMLDLKHKQFSSNQSDCGTLRSTTTAGTLRSKASVSSVFSKPSDYDTATIKRSHSQRNSSLINGTIRADLDSDQLFT